LPNIIVNTSPIQYLYQTHLLHLLPTLYDNIILPQAVVNELATGISLGVNLPDITTMPWIKVQSAKSTAILPLVTELGAGEREVLALAVEIGDSVAILDDNLARRYARLLNVSCTGTLGVLLKAKQSGYVQQIADILDRLNALNFRIAPATRISVLKLAGELL